MIQYLRFMYYNDFYTKWDLELSYSYLKFHLDRFHGLRLQSLTQNMKSSSYQYQPFSRPLFYFIFAVSLVVWVLTIVIVILEGVFGLVGSNNTVQISTSCDPLTQTYFYNKYNSNNQTIVTFCFAFTVIAVIFATAVTVILLVLLIKMVKEEVVAFRKAVKVSLYVCASLLIVSATVPAGYYLAFSRQLTQCAVTSYDSSQVLAVAIIAIIAVAFAFLIWVLLLIFFYERVSSEQKYREVSSHQTQPHQKAQVYKYEEEKPKKQPEVIISSPQKEQPRRQVYKLEETQQNLYESPSKRKLNYVYSKQPEQSIPQGSKNYSVLESKGPLASEEKKYTPERSYKKQPEKNPGPLLMMKQRNNPTVNRDQQAYKQYQQQYLGRNKGTGSILPSSGVQQRDFKGSDYFRSVGQPPRRFSPSKKSDKQGVLISYIRGKYAD